MRLALRRRRAEHGPTAPLDAATTFYTHTNYVEADGVSSGVSRESSEHGVEVETGGDWWGHLTTAVAVLVRTTAPVICQRSLQNG